MFASLKTAFFKLGIITSYCARLYGLRRSKRKTEKIIEELKKE